MKKRTLFLTAILATSTLAISATFANDLKYPNQEGFGSSRMGDSFMMPFGGMGEDSFNEGTSEHMMRGRKQGLKFGGKGSNREFGRMHKGMGNENESDMDNDNDANETGDTDMDAMHAHNTDMHDALDENNYQAFVAAWETHQPTVPTEEQFQKKVAFAQAHEAVQQAIEAKDYTGFIQAMSQLPKLGSGHDDKGGTPSEEKFQKMIQRQAGYEATHTALLANDYTGFLAALTQFPAHPGKEGHGRMMTPTAEEFAQMVARAQAEDNLHQALLAGDYTGFVTAREANKPTVPTEEAFAKIVEKRKAAQTSYLKKLEQLIQKIKEQLQK